MKHLLAILLACGSSVQAAALLTDAQRDWLSRHDKLIFASDSGYPPYTFVGADGQPRGLDVDVAKAVGQVLGVPVEFRMVPWEEAVALVSRGEADALAGMTHTQDRMTQWAFVEPHATVE